MARRNSEATASPESASTDTVVEPTEADAPTPEAPAAEAKPEVTLDISAFKSVVASILPEADTTTGDLSIEALARATEAYRALDGQKNKNAARDFIEESMREELMNDNGPTAKSFVLIRKSLSAGTTKVASKPKDPTEAFVSKLAQLVAAQTIVSENVPEGVTDDWVEKVNELSAKLTVEAREINALEDGVKVPDSISLDAKKVAKLASGRSVGGGSVSTYSGPRRNVGTHIANAFAELESGDFLTVNEIAKKHSDEYGDDEPSSGAISARLFPANDKLNLPEGIIPVVAEDSPDKKSRGARKA